MFKYHWKRNLTPHLPIRYVNRSGVEAVSSVGSDIQTLCLMSKENALSIEFVVENASKTFGYLNFAEQSFQRV